MKKTLLSLFVCGLALASCSKEALKDDSLKPVEGKTLVKVELSQKTHLGPASSEGTRKVYWSNGDKININGVSSNALSGIGDKESSADFEFEGLLSYPYNVVYPASAYKNATTITLPATQAWASGTFADNASPTIGYAASSSDALALKNISAVIKLKLLKGSSAATLSSVRFTGGNGEQVSGDFTVDYQKATITGASTTGASKSVAVSGINQALSSTAVDVMISVPAGTYNKFTVRFIDSQNHFMDVTKSSSITLAAGQIYSMPEVAFNPTGTEVNIHTADEYIAFVDAFHSGTYGNCDKTLCVNVCADLDFTGKALTVNNFTLGNGGTYNFAGTWNGNGCAMKNVNKGVSSKTDVLAMFYTPKEATIQDVVIDSSCEFLSNSTSKGGHWSPFVRIAYGCNIKNCTVNCDWNFEYGNCTETGNGYGMICGNLLKSEAGKGTVIENCTVNGNMNNMAKRTSALSGIAHVGGIVGYVNPGCTVKNCTMNGNYTVNESSVKPLCTLDKYFIEGGVAGQVSGGVVEECVMNGDVTYKEYVYNVFLGGVVGNVDGAGSVKNCTMAGNMTIDQTKSTKDYLRVFAGGVLGRIASNNSSASDLTSTAGKKLTVASGANAVVVGGIIGKVMHEITLNNLINNMAVEQNTVGGFGQMSIGGVGGAFDSAKSITNLLNTGAVTVKFPNPACTAVANSVGGVVGQSGVALDGGTVSAANVSSIHNSGAVSFLPDKTSVGYSMFSIGGVVGRCYANLTNVTNAGYIKTDYVTGVDAMFNYLAEGGIVGRMTAATTVKGCVSTSRVDCYGWATKNLENRVVFLGGIVGATFNGAASNGVKVTIDGCKNYGYINNTNRNGSYSQAAHTSGNNIGGIVGCLQGTSGNVGVCKNCLVQGEFQRYDNFVAAGKPDKKYFRTASGYIAGVVGYAHFADVTDNTCNTLFYQETATGSTISGIIGASGTSNVTGNKAYCDMHGGNVFGGICYAGNNGGSVFDNNDFNGTMYGTSDEAKTARINFGGILRNGQGATVTHNRVNGWYVYTDQTTKNKFVNENLTYCSNPGSGCTIENNEVYDD